MDKKILQAALLASLNFHFIVGLVLWFKPPLEIEKEKTIVEIEIKQTPPESNSSKKKSKKEKLRQVVAVDEELKESLKDPKSQLLGAKNQVVDKEMVAKKIGDFIKGAENKKSQQEVLAVDSVDKDLIPATKEELAAHEKEKDFEDISAANQSDDGLKDKELGNKTLLNTSGYVYFNYYKQIKKQLAKFWESKIREKMSRLKAQGRFIATTDDAVTRLFIIIDKQGGLAGVELIGKSGAEEIDAAAIEAFKEAAPFPKPPTGILDVNGNVKIRWEFVLESVGI